MNVKLTNTATKSTAQKVSEKAQRVVGKFMTNAEIQTMFDIDAQRYRNQVCAVYWVLHNKFGFTAEQLSLFSKEYTDNFPDINEHPAYLSEDIPHRAELEESLGMTIEELENM